MKLDFGIVGFSNLNSKNLAVEHISKSGVATAQHKLRMYSQIKNVLSSISGRYGKFVESSG